MLRSSRTRLSLGVFAIALGVVGFLLLALPSCQSLPEKTCRGEQVNGLSLDAGGLDPKCTTCLQQKCCDAVGYCGEDTACSTTFRHAHECVVEAGPAGESECINVLGASTQRSRQLYDCMRENCGGSVAADAPCGVSNCNVDPSVVLLASSTCDRCLGGSCCREINVCYGDRRCKLAIECIVQECKVALGPEMKRLGELSQASILEVRQLLCSNTAGSTSPSPIKPPPAIAESCVLGCLGAFAPIGGTADDDRARCLALDVYTCGAKAGCGAACTDETVLDAGEDATSEPVDASSD
jgi:hypothetical protein